MMMNTKHKLCQTFGSINDDGIWKLKTWRRFICFALVMSVTHSSQPFSRCRLFFFQKKHFHIHHISLILHKWLNGNRASPKNKKLKRSSPYLVTGNRFWLMNIINKNLIILFHFILFYFNIWFPRSTSSPIQSREIRNHMCFCALRYFENCFFSFAFVNFVGKIHWSMDFASKLLDDCKLYAFMMGFWNDL